MKATFLLLAFLFFPFFGFSQSYTFTNLVNFPATSQKSAINPEAPMIDPSGNIYGVSRYGGAHHAGTVWKVTPKSVLSVFYSFVSSSGIPQGTLARDSFGNLYGLTNGGGSGWGTIFKVTAQAKESIVYNFPSGVPISQCSLARDSLGDLYAYNDQAPTSVFESAPDGTIPTPCACHTFGQPTDGYIPVGGPILDKAGNLYGATAFGGDTSTYPEGAGTVFEVTPAGVETLLYQFTGGIDGGFPAAKLTQDNAGNLYGVTSIGGAYGGGTVFKVDPNGAETVLYSFGAMAGGSDGSSPDSPLVRDNSGNLYGITLYGGTTGNGVVFKVTPAGVETVLWGAAGSERLGYGLVMDKSGNIYGTTKTGGRAHNGSLYKLTKNN